MVWTVPSTTDEKAFRKWEISRAWGKWEKFWENLECAFVTAIGLMQRKRGKGGFWAHAQRYSWAKRARGRGSSYNLGESHSLMADHCKINKDTRTGGAGEKEIHCFSLNHLTILEFHLAPRNHSRFDRIEPVADVQNANTLALSHRLTRQEMHMETSL